MVRIKGRSLVFPTNLYNSLVNNRKGLLSTSGGITFSVKFRETSLIKDLLVRLARYLSRSLGSGFSYSERYYNSVLPMMQGNCRQVK